MKIFEHLQELFTNKLGVFYERSRNVISIKLSEKFLSFDKAIIDERQFLFYINLLNYDAFRSISIIMSLHNSIN